MTLNSYDKHVIMAVSSISSRIAHKLKALLQDQTWTPLHLSMDEERDLVGVLDRKAALTPSGRAITMYRLARDVKFYLSALERFLRRPMNTHGVAVEERIWHGACPLRLEREAALKGLDDLFARGAGRVSHIKEGNQIRVVLPHAASVLSRIAIAIDWADGDPTTKTQLWLERCHGLSEAESFWWLYFDQHQVAAYIAQSSDIELIIW
jgi:hypothetical protein